MALVPTSVQSINSGFLSVFQDGAGFIGGYLVTNAWGRPLEFRLSSAVQPTRVQQILYGPTLAAYLCGELIGKTLLEKTATEVQWVVTDNPLALDLRLRLNLPVGFCNCTAEAFATPPGLLIQPNLYCHAQFPDDIPAVRALIEKLGPFDLGEPFLRIREALGEARKMGVGRSAAA
jgi:hypothetical protein